MVEGKASLVVADFVANCTDFTFNRLLYILVRRFVPVMPSVNMLIYRLG
jgi:hypothetical protein